MTDTNPGGWPAEAREAVARAMRQRQYPERLIAGWYDEWQRQFYLAQADAALAALEPFVAARVAEARAAGMREAADIAARVSPDAELLILRRLAAILAAMPAKEPAP